MIRKGPDATFVGFDGLLRIIPQSHLLRQNFEQCLWRVPLDKSKWKSEKEKVWNEFEAKRGDDWGCGRNGSFCLVRLTISSQRTSDLLTPKYSRPRPWLQSRNSEGKRQIAVPRNGNTGNAKNRPVKPMLALARKREASSALPGRTMNQPQPVMALRMNSKTIVPTTNAAMRKATTVPDWTSSCFVWFLTDVSIQYLNCSSETA
jgi:hypothetical protein